MERRRSRSFLLRMPISLREEAIDAADLDGISFNQFICLALAEKLTRLRRKDAESHSPLPVSPISQLPIMKHPPNKEVQYRLA